MRMMPFSLEFEVSSGSVLLLVVSLRVAELVNFIATRATKVTISHINLFLTGGGGAAAAESTDFKCSLALPRNPSRFCLLFNRFAC